MTASDASPWPVLRADPRAGGWLCGFSLDPVTPVEIALERFDDAVEKAGELRSGLAVPAIEFEGVPV